MQQVIQCANSTNIIVKHFYVNIELNKFSILYWTNANNIDFIMNKLNTMIIGGAPKCATTMHIKNNNDDATANNNNTNNLSLSYAITLYDVFSDDDYDDIDFLKH